MSEKKRLPPWEEARLVFRMQEDARKRKLLEEGMKNLRRRGTRVGPNTPSELEENGKRLRELQKRLTENE